LAVTEVHEDVTLTVTLRPSPTEVLVRPGDRRLFAAARRRALGEASEALLTPARFLISSDVWGT
jgi:hypothetical protein